MFDKQKFTKERFSPIKGLFFLAVATLFFFVVGNLVMFLWNAILPHAIEAKPINFWQAIGLFLLFRILFGGLRYSFFGGKSGRRRSHRKKWKEKWINMDPEERAQFKQKWKDYCDRKNQK